MSKKCLYAALDTETTGVSVKNGDALLQVAAYVTDMDFNVLDSEGFERVARFTPEEAELLRSQAVPFVQEMHDKTQLWDRLSSPEAVTFAEMDEQLADYLRQFGADELYLLGNSITLDRNFMEAFLPEAFSVLHYRSLDVTSVRLFLGGKFGDSDLIVRTGESTHEARDDIQVSLETIRHYRSLIS